MNVSANSLIYHAHGCVMRSVHASLTAEAVNNADLRRHLAAFEQYDALHGVEAYGQVLLVQGETAALLAQFLRAQGRGYDNSMIGSGL